MMRKRSRDDTGEGVGKEESHRRYQGGGHKVRPNYKTGHELPPFVESSTYTPYTSPYGLLKFFANCGKNWDRYYANNGTHGYKDRHYILREFIELAEAVERAVKENALKKDRKPAQSPEASSLSCVRLVEIGCGVGNAVLPIVETLLETGNEEALDVYGFDISHVAVRLFQGEKLYKETKRFHAIVHDISEADVPIETLYGPSKQLAHFGTMIFVMSAIPVRLHGDVARRCADILELGAVLYFRDYCEADMAQRRFGQQAKVEDDSRTYTRSNGTLSYFFTVEEVSNLWKGAGFEVLKLDVVERTVTNRATGENMERRWLHGRFKLTSRAPRS